ncbi:MULTISPECIES: nucleoside 2-deoxyribosyltransferase [Achromobacter]|uniref:Nucleoside 2-deoxyribosyltransferase n=1 Tax=Achromobacter denitrificans TaxID=32002 RepID=A0A6N0JSZ3_ACHDE|nr:MULTISPECIES: nucleoside 2-deoxyribosyltransferase [Achromobacter]QKQ50319.1 nucleoside 2-deoxyribosyltransferase [Achromobacter denitrificans]
MPSVYLAGFDVFLPDAEAQGERLKALCAAHGFEGLFPLDNRAPRELSGAALAQWIYRENVALIRRADMVMANLNPFRGAEPDSGTAFEVGYAIACGKPVWGHTRHAGSLIDQVAVGAAADDGASRMVDAEGYTVEDFGLSLNLMLACSARIVQGDPADCLARMAESLPGASTPEDASREP